MLKKGKFIVATNELDSEKLSDEEVLKAYKCGALPHDPASWAPPTSPKTLKGFTVRA